MNEARIAVVGSGFSGATVSRKLAEKGFSVEVFEKRNHIGGNCYTSRDPESGVLVHEYGPHIFHTEKEDVWKFVTKFCEMIPYVHRVKAVTLGKVFSLPINLLTINQVFGKVLNPKEAELFIKEKTSKIENPSNFEEAALRAIGQDLYSAFFKHYTEKQWGRNPKEIPDKIFSRLPVRFDYNDNYFTHPFQGIPKEGYTDLIQNILNHKNIEIHLNREFKKDLKYFHVFYTGTLDSWFDYSEGRLEYRTLKFEKETFEGDFQGCAVMNYCDNSVPWTRICEHKHFAPWESHKLTTVCREYSFPCTSKDEPYYPVSLSGKNKILDRYLEKSKEEKNITFLGRLGTYRYIDMDLAIKEALDVADKFVKLTSG